MSDRWVRRLRHRYRTQDCFRDPCRAAPFEGMSELHDFCTLCKGRWKDTHEQIKQTGGSARPENEDTVPADRLMALTRFSIPQALQALALKSLTFVRARPKLRPHTQSCTSAARSTIEELFTVSRCAACGISDGLSQSKKRCFLAKAKPAKRRASTQPYWGTCKPKQTHGQWKPS